MGKKKLGNENTAQRIRTHANKRKKYEKLLAERPNDLHADKWREKLKNL
jgi:hypothetical protein